MPIRRELREELQRLTAEERQELADELYDSVLDATRDREWERAWAKELESRMGEVERGDAQLVDADEVHTDLQASIRDSRR